MPKHTRLLIIGLTLFISLAISISGVSAGDVILSNNSGSGTAIWNIEGEPSLVMNGFDLTPLALPLPLALDAVSIDIETPVPGAAVEVVVFQDGNGGSPIDATLVGRTTVNINSAGVFRATFDTPLVISQPVVWVGFYMPVGFQFRSDTSGTSVLTWWAWSPGSGFDPGSLGTAGVLGPADGTAPVNINMNGVARITAELISSNANAQQPGSTIPIGVQLVGDAATDMSPLVNYEYCGPVFYDREDIFVSSGDEFDLYCRADVNVATNPTTIFPNGDFERHGFLYDISAFGNYRFDQGDTERLRVAVTHCIRPRAEDLEQAVIGVAYGSPRSWHILPTVRFGELVCAEITHIGNLSYFVPRVRTEPGNLNLVFGSLPIIDPHPLQCNRPSRVTVTVTNNGPQPTSQVGRIAVFDHVLNSDVPVQEVGTTYFPPLQAGQSYTTSVEVNVSDYSNQGHQLEIRLDVDNAIAELNESDNTFTSDYVLQLTSDCPLDPANLNITFLGFPVIPARFQCNVAAQVIVPIVNPSRFATPASNRVLIEDLRVADGTVTSSAEFTFPIMPANSSYVGRVTMIVSTYFNEQHQIRITIDPDDVMIESNENDNVFYGGVYTLPPC